MEGRYFRIGEARYDFPCIFLVEGKDDAMLLDVLFAKLGVDSGDARIVICEGKAGFGKHLPLLTKSFAFVSKIKAIAIVRDADDSEQIALSEVHAVLRKAMLPQPASSEVLEHAGKRYGVYLLPRAGQIGDLETLALEIAESSETFVEASAFIQRASARVPEIGKVNKRKIQAFLAGHSREIRPTVGWAFKDGTIPVSPELLPELSCFVREVLGIRSPS